MRKCFRYAGCVAFNFYETGNFDICELFSKIVPTRENITGHKVTRGFFSDTCGDIDNFTDYRFVKNQSLSSNRFRNWSYNKISNIISRLSRDVSLVFKKKAIEVPQEMQDELLRNVFRRFLFVNQLHFYEVVCWKVWKQPVSVSVEVHAH